MKQFFSAIVAIFILTVAFYLPTQMTGSPIAGAVVAGGIVAFSAAKHFLPGFMPQGIAFFTVEIPNFTEKEQSEIDKMPAADFEKYLAEKNRHADAVRKKETLDMIIELKKSDGDKEKLNLLETQMKTLIEENNHALLALKKQAEQAAKGAAPVGILKSLQDNDEILKAIAKGDKSKGLKFDIEIETKAQQNPSDIGNRTDFAMMLPGVDKIPHRRTYVKNRIKTVPTGKEYIKYIDQETVVRDAKNVAQCGTTTHNTKLTWTTRNMQITKTRDLIDVCIDMMDDYDYIEGEIRELVTSSLQLKIDSDLVVSDAVYPNPNSIQGYSSTFNAANPSANYASTVQSATIIDLIVVAAAQISAFGEENFFMADTVYMNPRDYTLMTLLKDNEDNYIKAASVDPRIFQDRNGMTYINGNVLVLPNPNVPANEFFIFDSMKATIYQRKTATVEFSFENDTNFEEDVVTIKATERYNMLVKNNQANAFMHVDDISAGITAITA
jgi:hypothetical protein